MLIATFNFHPSPYMYFIKGKSVFQDRATQDAPNSDRVATKPYLRQFWGSALTASNASVLTLAISALQKCLLGCPQTRWTSGHRDQKKYCLRRRPYRVCSLLRWLSISRADDHAALDGHQLPHILLGLAVFQIKSFFPRCQLAAFFF